MTDPFALRSLAENVARQVGEQVVARRSAGFTWETKSSTADVVTEIDTWAEQAVVDLLSVARPNDGLLGEEGTSTTGSTGVLWTIDPIDGTTNLLYDIPGYSVSIGASLDGVPVVGAVFDPVRSELFSAAVGDGATRNGQPISPSSSTDLSTSLLGTGFSYESGMRAHQGSTMKTILPAVRDIRRLGGAALDLCNVACGRLDAYFERNLSPWDFAAGALIAAEAGASVITGPLTRASTPGIVSDLDALLASAEV